MPALHHPDVYDLLHIYDSDFRSYAGGFIEQEIIARETEAEIQLDYLRTCHGEWCEPDGYCSLEDEMERWWYKQLAPAIRRLRREWLQMYPGDETPTEKYLRERKRRRKADARAERLNEKRAADAREMQQMQRRLQTMELLMAEHDIPAPCVCGRITQEVYCPCGKRLR